MGEVNRVGVFGGTFDPVHVGHLIIAEILRHELGLSHVIFLPAGRPPHKLNQALSSDADRITMLELSIAGSAHFSISSLDLDRAGPSFTSDSLRLLNAEFDGEHQLHFLMGQDSLRDFPTWHRPDLIAQQSHLAVALRPGFDVSVDDVVAAVPEAHGRIDLISVPLIGISSRDLRAAIQSGGPYRFQVVPAVANYIEERALYCSVGTAPSAARPRQD